MAKLLASDGASWQMTCRIERQLSNRRQLADDLRVCRITHALTHGYAGGMVYLVIARAMGGVGYLSCRSEFTYVHHSIHVNHSHHSIQSESLRKT